MNPNGEMHPATGPPAHPFADRSASRLFRSASFSRSLGTYLPATVLFRLINFVRILILIRCMTSEHFGLLAMVLLMGNVLTPLCGLGLCDAVARYAPRAEEQGSLTGFYRRSMALVVGVAIAAVILLAALSPLFAELFFGQPLGSSATPTSAQTARGASGAGLTSLAALAGLVVGLLVVYFYFLAMLRGLRMFAALSWMELSHGILFLMGACVGVMVGWTTAAALTILYAISVVGPIAYFAPRLARAISGRSGDAKVSDAPGLARKLLAFGVWTALAAGTWQLLLYCPQWFLNMVHGPDTVAIFNAVRQVAQFILLAGVAVSTVVMTNVTKTWETEGPEPAQRQLSLVFRATGLGLFALCAVLALGKDFIILMFGPAYGPGADILPLQLLFFLFGGFLSFLPAHFHLREQTRYMIWPWSIGILANMLIYWLAAGSGVGAVAPEGKSGGDGFVRLLLSTGFDPLGLASWCAAAAMAIGTGVCLWLIHRRCAPLDRGTIFVVTAALLLAARWWILLVGAVVVITLALQTTLVFNRDERTKVWCHTAKLLRGLPIGSGRK